MSKTITLPAFYQSRKWQDSIGKMPLSKRLEERIYEMERKVNTLTLKELQEIWKTEPYWEISRIIISSKDFIFPK